MCICHVVFCSLYKIDVHKRNAIFSNMNGPRDYTIIKVRER